MSENRHCCDVLVTAFPEGVMYTVGGWVPCEIALNNPARSERKQRYLKESATGWPGHFFESQTFKNFVHYAFLRISWPIKSLPENSDRKSLVRS